MLSRCVCLSLCTTQHRTVLIMLPRNLQTFIVALIIALLEVRGVYFMLQYFLNFLVHVCFCVNNISSSFFRTTLSYLLERLLLIQF